MCQIMKFESIANTMRVSARESVAPYSVVRGSSVLIVGELIVGYFCEEMRASFGSPHLHML